MASSGELDPMGLPAGAGVAAARTTGATVMGGAAWYASSLIAPQLFAVVMSVVAARYLGPALFGRQSFIAFVELSVALLFSEGMYAAFMRNVGETLGEDRAPALRGLLRFVWVVEAGAALLGGGALAVVALAGAQPRGAWLFAAVACGMGILQAAPGALLLGAQRWRAASTATLATGLVSMIATVLVLQAGGGIVGMFAVEAGVSTASLGVVSVLALRTLRQLAPGPAAPFGDIARRVVSYALPATGRSILTLIVWRRSEFFVLAHYSTTVNLALYSVSYAGVTALTRLPSALNGTLAPAFATLHGAGARERISSGYGRAFRLIVVVTLPPTAAAAALGPAAIRLVYGRSFGGATPVLLILLLAVPVFAIGGLSEALLTGLGRVRYLIIADGIAAVLDIVLALALVPELDAVGAAIANTTAQIAYGVVVVVYSRRLLVRPELRLRWLSGITVASGVSALAAFGLHVAVGGWPGFLLGLLAGAALLALLALRLPIFSPDDAAWLRSHVGDRMLGVPAWVLDRVAPA
jgi:O-antigen/teichoic acid export membrane protein